MATPASSSPLSGLARRLVQEGLLSEDKAKKAVADARESKTSFIDFVVENKLASAPVLMGAASREFSLPAVDLQEFEIDPEAAKLVSKKIIEKHGVFPIFRRGKRLCVVCVDPTAAHAASDEIKFATGMQIDLLLAEKDKLQVLLESEGDADGGAAFSFDEDEFEKDTLDKVDAVAGDDTAGVDASDDGGVPVVRFVNKMLLDAIKKGASDLHFEPYEKSFRVRLRIDGELSEVSKLPQQMGMKLAARIKVMSRLDISERRVPQDGRIKLKISASKAIDFRVSTCPTLFGEKCVLRILDSDAAKLQIDQLGYEDFQKDLFLKNLQRPYGMFLVTGPTGSGKTVSLYTGINILNTVGINISTAEDPVEINLAGVNQVQIDERTGMTFPKALKAFLRQDPDIILVGEIRDIETASIAVKAAQTGHMVMSTLHTNDCPQTLTRLQDMGVQSFAVATSINLITAQRLCRKLLPDAKVAIDVPKEALLKDGFPEEVVEQGFTVYEPREGADPAYKGRAGLYQVMPISEKLKRLIIEEANAVQLADQAKAEGVWDIRRSGLQKVVNGLTSLSEINRLTIE